MRVQMKSAFWFGLVAAIVASGAIEAAMQDDVGSGTSAKGGSRARVSAEPSPTPSSEPAATPSPTPKQSSAAADDGPVEICYPVATLKPLPKITAVVDPRTGLKTFKKTYEDTEPPEPVCVPVHQPSYSGYPYSNSLPYYSPQVMPTNAPGYGPGFGAAGSGYGAPGEKDRRVPILTDHGRMPDFAPSVPRAPAPRVPAFIP